MIGLKNSYEIAYNGTENECRFELYADTSADLQGLTHIDGIKIQMGSECTDIATGDKYILNGSGVWVLQPAANAFSNVYTKVEIDSMITEINGVIAYYHTVIVSDTGEITFYALAGYIGTWKIYGNGQQTGTPTPDAPIPFIGCGTREVYEVSVTYPSSAYTYEVRKGKLADAIKQLGAGRYTFSWDFQSNATGTFKDRLRIYVNGFNKLEIANGQTIDFTETFVQEIQRARNFSIQLYYGQGNTDGYFKDFVIDAGYKIPLTCAGQTVPVYLGQTQTVRKIRKLVLDGTETWTDSVAGIHCITLPGYLLENTNVPFCTHYAGISPVSEAGNVGELRVAFLISASGNNYMYIHDSTYNTATAFQAYLAAQYAAGTPVTIWYVLAEPETAIVNEPLCKIGDYADELHSTDAGVSIPTVKGSNTLTVDTTLKPSKIEISGER